MAKSPCAILSALRVATGDLHHELEALTASDRILDGRLTPSEYLQLVDWQRRAHLLLEPLAQGVQHDQYAYQSLVYDGDAIITARGTAIGIAYVLEGSSLGSGVILRKLLANPSLAAHAPFDFYAARAGKGLIQWKEFLHFLEGEDFDTDTIERAAAGARWAFTAFKLLWNGHHVPAG